MLQHNVHYVLASQTILSSISRGELIFSWSDFIIKVEMYGISSHSVLISGRDNLSLRRSVDLWMQNQRRASAPYILLFAPGLTERGPIVLHNNSIPLTNIILWSGTGLHGYAQVHKREQCNSNLNVNKMNNYLIRINLLHAFHPDPNVYVPFAQGQHISQPFQFLQEFLGHLKQPLKPFTRPLPGGQSV